jgi:hypothetical protein
MFVHPSTAGTRTHRTEWPRRMLCSAVETAAEVCVTPRDERVEAKELPDVHHQADSVSPVYPTDPTTRSLPSALYLLPWPQGAPQEGRASWRWEELEGWRVPNGRDWTTPLRSSEAWRDYLAKGWTP